MKFFSIKTKHVQGILEPNSSRKYQFQRLPQKYRDHVRKEVWNLSENSAGVSLSFSSDTSNLLIRWTIKNHFKMNHMTDVGVSGFDLYQKKNNEWHFISAGIPNDLKNETYLFKGLQRGLKHYRIHFPLYNTLTDLELGFDSNSRLKIITKNGPSLIFYGTSITQGGCASRPGLAYTNIISRKLNRNCINLGFSGNGHLEISIAHILAKIDNAIFIIDCMWNIDDKIVVENTKPFIDALRSKIKNFKSSIIFLEQYLSNLNHPDKKFIKSVIKKNRALKKQIENEKNKGFKNLYLVEQDGCIDEDSEATVDGVHFNDLGFERFSRHLINKLRDNRLI
ncbi:MAG: SGNH/GDSL hydrolase family protein [Candidatus Neomarinimicrobiota bacterium]